MQEREREEVTAYHLKLYNEFNSTYPSHLAKIQKRNLRKKIHNVKYLNDEQQHFF